MLKYFGQNILTSLEYASGRKCVFGRRWNFRMKTPACRSGFLFQCFRILSKHRRMSKSEMKSKDPRTSCYGARVLRSEQYIMFRDLGKRFKFRLRSSTQRGKSQERIGQSFAPPLSFRSFSSTLYIKPSHYRQIRAIFPSSETSSEHFAFVMVKVVSGFRSFHTYRKDSMTH